MDSPANNLNEILREANQCYQDYQAKLKSNESALYQLQQYWEQLQDQFKRKQQGSVSAKQSAPSRHTKLEIDVDGGVNRVLLPSEWGCDLVLMSARNNDAASSHSQLQKISKENGNAPVLTRVDESTFIIFGCLDNLWQTEVLEREAPSTFANLPFPQGSQSMLIKRGSPLLTTTVLNALREGHDLTTGYCEPQWYYKDYLKCVKMKQHSKVYAALLLFREKTTDCIELMLKCYDDNLETWRNNIESSEKIQSIKAEVTKKRKDEWLELHQDKYEVPGFPFTELKTKADKNELAKPLIEKLEKGYAFFKKTIAEWDLIPDSYSGNITADLIKGRLLEEYNYLLQLAAEERIDISEYQLCAVENELFLKQYCNIDIENQNIELIQQRCKAKGIKLKDDSSDDESDDDIESKSENPEGEQDFFLTDAIKAVAIDDGINLNVHNNKAAQNNSLDNITPASSSSKGFSKN